MEYLNICTSGFTSNIRRVRIANTTFSDADFGVVGALLGVLAGNFNKYIILVVFAVFIY